MNSVLFFAAVPADTVSQDNPTILLASVIIFGPTACMFLAAGVYGLLRSRKQKEFIRLEFARIRELPEKLIHKVDLHPTVNDTASTSPARDFADAIIS